MSGFSADWLNLREPADHAAINTQVRDALCRHFKDHEAIAVVDLGSGTGSNFRSLAPALSQWQTWTLVDVDTHLLTLAEERSRHLLSDPSVSASFETIIADLATTDLASLFAEADLVTASALFDLVSTEMIERLITTVTSIGAGFYTTLTYDGIAAWLPEHPANTSMRTAFNAHQQTDKGFGPAAGPHATTALARGFEQAGYHILLGKSPWILDDNHGHLRHQIDQGWAAAVSETSTVASKDITSWLNARETNNNTITIVGHEDLLALPTSPV